MDITLGSSGLMPGGRADLLQFGHRQEREAGAGTVPVHAARSMGANPGDCIVVEDSVAGVTAGVAAGMRVMAYAAAAYVDRQGMRRAGGELFEDMASTAAADRRRLVRRASQVPRPPPPAPLYSAIINLSFIIIAGIATIACCSSASSPWPSRRIQPQVRQSVHAVPCPVPGDHHRLDPDRSVPRQPLKAAAHREDSPHLHPRRRQGEEPLWERRARRQHDLRVAAYGTVDGQRGDRRRTAAYPGRCRQNAGAHPERPVRSRRGLRPERGAEAAGAADHRGPGDAARARSTA